MAASPTGQEDMGSIAPAKTEIAVAVLGFALSYALVAIAMTSSRDPALIALTGLAGSATIGSVAATVAVSVRIRELAALGIRRAGMKQVLTGAVVATVIYVLGAAAGLVPVAVAGSAFRPDAAFEAAATGGWVSLSLTFLTGAILTPLGGEPALRSDDHRNSILRRRPEWFLMILAVSFLVSALRGSPLVPMAFAVGILTALLVRWCVAVAARGPHIVRISKMAYTLTTQARVD
ncbi:hypothetical protein J2S40_001287 [Nocardioides luteus]|uniref:Uncharacterized protein n=1 Tax=Nocardioides luteus TaxID=1844 RepID=A0ABQ5T1F1_9ACTN|nr:hypothetical protein [Nocardioides luteus]MDR7310229.1 hypothetical protein [Nocardioides luteus]GGR69723.1 hypothetical protein GCM10010197_41530 [Nocardioides luteus]GLJ70303.1 hypothetical protein GCM10017579_43390 [Nocardioides luteus]